MAADVSKHLDRAKRFLEKNRVEDAIEAYLAVLDEMPQHQEATQALGDLYARMDQPDRAAIYYGLLFDLLVEPKDETKALAIYNRFLRAGQLATASGASADALHILGRAYKLAPQERSVGLLYAQANLQAGNAVRAAALLEPFAASEKDPAFLITFSDALMRSGNLERARELLDQLLREKNQGMTQLFELADRYVAANQDQKATEILLALKRRMFADKRQNDFVTLMDGVGAKYPDSQAILEFWASIHNELNRESQYFEVLIKLFDVYLTSGNVKRAAESLERLVDIDAYDYRNQERLELLRGKVDEAQLKRIASRLMKSSTPTPGHTAHAHAPQAAAAAAPSPGSEEGRQLQALEDLIVQTEIFLQYSLQNKALERLQRIAAMFPGEEERNARLSNLYQMANWWPPGSPKPKAETAAVPPTVPAAPVAHAAQAAEAPSPITTKTGVYSAETLRDLSKISEVNQKIFRQQTPRAMLNTAVSEVGAYLRGTRALAVVGTPGRPPEMAAEFCAPGVKPAPGAQVVLLLAHIEKAEPDELGGLVVQATEGSILSDLGLATALGVVITDKETQMPAGMLIVGHAEAHKWRPNEAYFLQAIGDQMLMSVSHTRLRSLVRRMGVSDERSGLLSRSSYQSCLLTEADRARTQGTPLALTILQIDRGAEILRQQGETPLARFLEQLARSLQPIVRQNDVPVKYTSWALAFILPDTTLAGGQNLEDKLPRAASGLRPPWDSTPITVSAGTGGAVAQPDYDSENIVTGLSNRGEL